MEEAIAYRCDISAGAGRGCMWNQLTNRLICLHLQRVKCSSPTVTWSPAWCLIWVDFVRSFHSNHVSRAVLSRLLQRHLCEKPGKAHLKWKINQISPLSSETLDSVLNHDSDFICKSFSLSQMLGYITMTPHCAVRLGQWTSWLSRRFECLHVTFKQIKIFPEVLIYWRFHQTSPWRRG